MNGLHPIPWRLDLERNGTACVRAADDAVVMEIESEGDGMLDDLATAERIVAAVNAHEMPLALIEAAYPAMTVKDSEASPDARFAGELRAPRKVTITEDLNR